MKKPLLNRRAFIRLALLGGIGTGIGYLQVRAGEVGLWNFLRWMMRGQLQKVKPAAIVGLVKCPSYSDDLVSKLREVWTLAEMPDVRGKNILIKPNLLDDLNNHLATTHPKVVGAMIDLLQELGAATITVGDGSAFRRDTTSVVKSSGMEDEMVKRGVQFVDLNYDELRPVKTRDGWIRETKQLWLPRIACEADMIISMPKLKTHHWAEVTLSLKNLLGLIPGSRYGWPKNIIHMNGINATILGIHQSIPTTVVVVDGIVGMEGNGPLDGKPIEHGLLAAGKDLLAVDITCARLMGFAIDSIPHLAGAVWAGIGQAVRIETRGAPMTELERNYEKPPTI